MYRWLGWLYFGEESKGLAPKQKCESKIADIEDVKTFVPKSGNDVLEWHHRYFVM